MFLSYITLAVALSLSVIAAYYSIAGLAAIFAAAVIPIVVMGSILELGKVVVTLWLHEYWRQCRFLMKMYLVPAVAVLMLVTSMGIFGFLSKAHSDQSLVSGDVQSKIAVYDEKIKVSQDNIDVNRKALKQLDEAVDQVMGRSSSETGADKAVAIRKSQAKERTRLLAEIAAEQKTISDLRQERAPIAAEVRKVEAEVGPIKYIATLIYGDNPDANLLEKAVTWVIMLLVIVFDPLAIMMLLAATESLKWEKQRLFDLLKMPVPEPEPDLKVVNQMLAAAATIPEPQEPVVEPKSGPMKFFDPGEHPKDYDETEVPVPEPVPEKTLLEQHPYLGLGFSNFKDLKPMPYIPERKLEVYSGNPDDFKEPWSEEDRLRLAAVMETFLDKNQDEDPELSDDHPSVKAAMVKWKLANPGATLKEQRAMFARGEIAELPWLALIDNNASESGFGLTLPATAHKGDTWVLTSTLPNRVYKFNGNKWISVDKTQTDNYTYNEAYLDHLIAKLESGEYDIELLSSNEQEQITQRLQKKTI
jgi:hypothetical protein